MTTKAPTTIQQQIEILESRGIIIDDKNFCINALECLNYYRLSAYMLQYKKIGQDTYTLIAFETIYHIHEFDRKLRVALLSVLEEVELLLRAKLAHYHAHAFGALGYLDTQNHIELNLIGFPANWEKILQTKIPNPAYIISRTKINERGKISCVKD